LKNIFRSIDERFVEKSGRWRMKLTSLGNAMKNATRQLSWKMFRQIVAK
jgi:hypothetical protein